MTQNIKIKSISDYKTWMGKGNKKQEWMMKNVKHFNWYTLIQ